MILGAGIDVMAAGQDPVPSPAGELQAMLTDRSSGEPLGFAACLLTSADTGREYGTVTAADGRCRWTEIPVGTYALKILYMGRVYVLNGIRVAAGVNRLEHAVEIDPTEIAEVVVTASESRGMTSSSSIGQDAMSHIQPSSIADVMALLPGGSSIDPALGAPQSISLRTASTMSGGDYDTGALGTAFVVDGVPINTDANMQSSHLQTEIDLSGSYDFLNKGVDTRTVSTDDIESVEVIRGIPSVEYGDLTSGVVNIRRKQGGRDVEARFKADMSSKLFHVGKGFEWGDSKDRLTMNVGANWLDARSDPRNTRQNYSRATLLYRINREWEAASPYRFSLGGSLDYTGSFDRRKSDRNLDVGDHGPVERFSSDYNRLTLSGSFGMRAKGRQFFQQLDLTASVTGEFDRIDRWRYVAAGREIPLSTSLDEGEHDVITLPAQYEATLRVDGRPFYAFVKAVSRFGVGTGRTDHSFKLGAEWRMDKNYGKGYIFDVTRPISYDMNLRPRAYDAIPAKHQLSAFAEYVGSFDLGAFGAEVMAGVRSTTVANIGSEYSLNGRTYLDPRLNMKVSLPDAMLFGHSLMVSFTGGVGWHTKMPTMAQLFPDPIYYDVTQMNYWPSDNYASLRRINVKVFRIDPANYDLRAARNFKWEVRTDMLWNGYSLSVTYFNEDMTSGFRQGSSYGRYIYKDYDEQSIDMGSLTGPPSLEETPFELDTLLVANSFWTNGSRTRKEGVEFVFTTRRIEPLRTRLTVTGAYFRTRYSNSEPEYYRPSVLVNGKTYPYVGYYRTDDNYLRERFNTNFMLDTQIPRLGLIFSTTFECTWYVGSQTLPYDAWPIAYIDQNLEWHPFTEESAANGVLAEMIRTANSTIFRYGKIPFAMNVNLKVSKKLYHDKLTAALFVNRLIAYCPPYYRDGSIVRRESQPYFGMELNFKL